MHREQRRAQPRARHAQFREQPPQQERGDRMQEDVFQMVAERILSVELMVKPEAGVRDRIILLRRARFEPDAAQASQRAQGQIGGHIDIVVPDEPGAQDREINQTDQQQERQAG